MDFEKYVADLNSQPIEGYLHTGEYVSIPLISHITDNLYVGGYDAVANLGDYFTHVFSFYAFEPAYLAGEDVEQRVYKMYDAPGEVDEETLDKALLKIVPALESGGNVLIHCQAGINRSNLAAASALRIWKGMTSREAIALLREKRSNAVLSNKSFENYLLSLDDEGAHTR